MDWKQKNGDRAKPLQGIDVYKRQVDTEMTEVLSEEIRENACKQIILGRFGKPEDIANTAVFLASDKADYITGQVISVDGGMNV